MQVQHRYIVYIDMDQTLCDYVGQYLLYQQRYPEYEYPQSIHGFFESIPALPNAIDTYLWLHNHPKCDVSILTAPSLKNLHCYSEKAKWVYNNLGEDVLPKLIISNDKHKNHGHFLIDDMTEGRGQNMFNGQLLQFGSKNFPDWLSIRAYFEDILK